MIDPSEKLSNDHAHHAQSCGLGNATLELSEYGSELRTFGEFECLADQLIEGFAQRSVVKSVIASSSAVLQPTDQVEMAELNDPVAACAEFDNSGNLVGNRRSNATVHGGGNGCEGVRPPLHVLSAFAQYRIEEDRLILIAGLDRHQIQDPILASKAKVQSVQDQNQRSFGQVQTARLGAQLSQSSTKTPSQPLMSKTVSWSESFQCATVEQHCFESSSTCSPKLAAASFLADSPRTLAPTALTTSTTEAINFRSATWRFRVPRMHARELHTD